MKRLAICVLFIAGCRHAQVPLPSTPAALAASSIDRGRVIVRDAAVCGGCHSGSERDPDGALSGGKEFRDWRIGTIHASNLTPDEATGLGSWSEAEIVRAIRNGVDKDGRLLAPVMPYEWLHEMSDDDAFAVARYLKSLPPVRNEVKQNPNIVFKIGKLLFLRPLPALPVAAPPHGATPEYGTYLSQHVALCAECHTPRTGIRSAPDKTRLFAGMPHPPKDFPANPSNLTPDPTTGIGTWTENNFLDTLRRGVDPAGHSLHPFMPWQQNRRLSDDDLLAIYRFLRTVPPIRQTVPRASAK